MWSHGDTFNVVQQSNFARAEVEAEGFDHPSEDHKSGRHPLSARKEERRRVGWIPRDFRTGP